MTTETLAKVLKVQPFKEFWAENIHMSEEEAMKEWKEFVYEINLQVRLGK